MNIFVLDPDPSICAAQAGDKHVVKMILESAQMLSTVLGNLGLDAPYRPTHRNHPCTLWAGESYPNFCWLLQLMSCYNDEYRMRYRKRNGVNHKSCVMIHSCIAQMGFATVITAFASKNFRTYREEYSADVSVPPTCMPTQYKVFQEDGFQTLEDVVQSYRNYYLGEKRHLLKYTNRAVPNWVQEGLRNGEAHS